MQEMDPRQDKTYYIYRHADTWATKHGRPYWLDFYSAPIIKSDIKKVRHLSKYLANIQINQNYSSPLRRCNQTASIKGEVSS